MHKGPIYSAKFGVGLLNSCKESGDNTGSEIK